MTNKSILETRHSARAFTNEPVKIETLKDIIKEANLAPSWENTQPWKVYLATGKTTQKIQASHLASVNKQQKSWTEVVPPQEWSKATQANIDHWLTDAKKFLGDQETQDFFKSNTILFDAPAIVYITIPKGSSHYSAYDAGAFGYGVLLAAYEHGIGAISAYELIRFPQEIRDNFDIPDDESLMMEIALGHPQNTKINDLRTSRNALETILQTRD